MEKITQPLTSVNYLVFCDTFDKLHTQVEGTVFALRKPQIVLPREIMLALDDHAPKQRRSRLEFSSYYLEITKSSITIAFAQAIFSGVSGGEPAGRAWRAVVIHAHQLAFIPSTLGGI